MGIMSRFASETNIGIQDAMRADDHPEVREATKHVLELRAKRDEAKAQLRPTNELTLAAITARGEFEQAERAVEAAEEVLRQVREGEIAKIFAARRGERSAILQKLNGILEQARGASAELLEHDDETQRLAGRGWPVGAGDTHMFSPIMPDTPLMQSHLTAWQRALRTEGWL